MSEISFAERVAVVTGAGNGLGKAYAMELARRGAHVVVNDLGGSVSGEGGEHSAADQTVNEITEAGGKAVANYDSVSTPEGGAAIIQTAIDAFGTVDIVINNAGILRDKAFHNMELADIKSVIDVHLMGAFYVTQPAWRVMREKGYGRVLMTSSNSGLLGNFGQTNYGAAKAGLAGLARVLSIEGAKYNVKCNAIAPIARTRMTEELLGPLAEFLDPEQVVPMSLYLVSEECEVSGEFYSAGGGRYARMFTGLTEGWFGGKGSKPTIEEIKDHFDEIRSDDTYSIPANSGEEIMPLAGKLM